MKHVSETTTDRKATGFTLAELLVSMTVLSVLLLMLTQLLSQIQQTWTYSEARISQFREARVAFDIITKNLSQATLHTYLDYERNSENQVTNYKRQSELHFATGFADKDLKMPGAKNAPTHAIFFQAPLGKSDVYSNLENLFNARGYYILYGDDKEFKPSFIQSDPKFRFRLMEYLPPAEENQIYIDGDAERKNELPVVYDEWYKHQLSKYSHPLAENVIALFISPRESLDDPTDTDVEKAYRDIAPKYAFDSNTTIPKFKQQVPPLVKVTLVAIDETSANRLNDESGGVSMPDMELFKNFTSVREYDQDLEELKKELNDRRIKFKVFSTMVAIRSSKWSKDVVGGSTP